jgi:hypothetical protein
MRAIPDLKETLQLNVKFASRARFVPVPAGWQERSTFIEQDGRGFITSISNGWNPTCIVFSPFTRRLFERP